MQKFEKLIHDTPLYKEIKHNEIDHLKKTWRTLEKHNYGTLDVIDNDTRSVIFTPGVAVCISVLIFTWLAFVITLLVCIIDSIRNTIYYQDELHALIRGGEIFLIVLICSYVVMIPFLLITLCNKKYNTGCYEKTCSDKTLFCSCKLCLDFLV